MALPLYTNHGLGNKLVLWVMQFTSLVRVEVFTWAVSWGFSAFCLFGCFFGGLVCLLRFLLLLFGFYLVVSIPLSRKKHSCLQEF